MRTERVLAGVLGSGYGVCRLAGCVALHASCVPGMEVHSNVPHQGHCRHAVAKHTPVQLCVGFVPGPGGIRIRVQHKQSDHVGKHGRKRDGVGV